MSGEISQFLDIVSQGVRGVRGSSFSPGDEARALTGLNDDSLRLLAWSDFVDTSHYSTQSRSGGTFSVQNGSGIIRIVGGSAQQGGIVRVAPGNTLMTLQQAKRFYAKAQFIVATNQPNANSRIYFQVGTTTVCHVACGFNGTNNGTFFGFSCNTLDSSNLAPKLNVLSTKTPFVGALVTARIWYDGDFVYGAVDDEPRIQIADASVMTANPVNDLYFDSFPSGGTQTDAVDIDYMEVWGEA